jgi:hypothetical protein
LRKRLLILRLPVYEFRMDLSNRTTAMIRPLLPSSQSGGHLLKLNFS